MKFYIQQTALDRLKRTAMKMDSTGRETAQISLEPMVGFVEINQSNANNLEVIELQRRMQSAVDTLDHKLFLFLLNFHDREWHYFDPHNKTMSQLVSLGLLERDPDTYNCGTRITDRGFSITTTAITAANGMI